MNVFRLRLAVRAEPGALQRVLVMLSKRQFEPVRVAAETQATGRWSMDLEVRGNHPVEPLARLLEGLFDVERVEVLP